MDDLGERTEEPTARKLSDARKKGQVARSQDLSGAISLLGVLVIFLAFGSTIAAMFARITRRSLEGSFAADIRSTETIAASAKVIAYEAMVVVVPVMVLAAIVAYIGGFVQVGWLISGEAVRPKLSKLSPLAGLKRIMGVRALMKTVVNSMKLTVMVVVSTLFILSNLDAIAAMPRLKPLMALTNALKLIYTLAIILVILLIFIAIIDFVYQKWQHTKDLRMSKQEVKDERKTMEGDPLIKGKRRQMAREIAMQQIGKSVPEADVIVTNPTHFSVAIRYDPEKMSRSLSARPWPEPSTGRSMSGRRSPSSSTRRSPSCLPMSTASIRAPKQSSSVRHGRENRSACRLLTTTGCRLDEAAQEAPSLG